MVRPSRSTISVLGPLCFMTSARLPMPLLKSVATKEPLVRVPVPLAASLNVTAFAHVAPA